MISANKLFWHFCRSNESPPGITFYAMYNQYMRSYILKARSS